MSNFWTNGLEPKRVYRFKVGLVSTTNTEDSVVWWAKSVVLPAWDVSEVEHNYLDNKYYFPGRVTWQDISMTLVDPISVNAAAKTNKLLVDQNYLVKSTSAEKPQTVSHDSSLSITIEIYDASGDTIVESWTVKRAFVKSAKYGDLDYSSDDLKSIELSFRYDWAECTTKTGSETAVTFFAANASAQEGDG